MPQFLYRLHPNRLGMIAESPTERESAILDEHFEYLQRLTAQGIVYTAGRTQNADERTFGIVILKAESESGAAELMRNDPAVRGGVMRAELFRFQIALWSTEAPSIE